MKSEAAVRYAIEALSRTLDRGGTATPGNVYAMRFALKWAAGIQPERDQFDVVLKLFELAAEGLNKQQALARLSVPEKSLLASMNFLHVASRDVVSRN
jgi:hypothetical protein